MRHKTGILIVAVSEYTSCNFSVYQTLANVFWKILQFFFGNNLSQPFNRAII